MSQSSTVFERWFFGYQGDLKVTWEKTRQRLQPATGNTPPATEKLTSPVAGLTERLKELAERQSLVTSDWILGGAHFSCIERAPLLGV